MSIQWNNELYHYGMPRRSGRYKWGSGKNPYHHGQSTASGRVRSESNRTQIKKGKLIEQAAKREYRQLENSISNHGRITKDYQRKANRYHDAIERIADPNTTYRQAKKAYKQAKKQTKREDGFQFVSDPRSMVYGNAAHRQYMMARNNTSKNVNQYSFQGPETKKMFGIVGKYSFGKIDHNSVIDGRDKYEQWLNKTRQKRY